MEVHSRNLQYMVREHLLEHEADDEDVAVGMGHGELSPERMLHLRWNSQFGKVFVDGQHNAFDLALGDEINVESHAPELHIFEE